jgi:SAM-dependent methyltransferase
MSKFAAEFYRLYRPSYPVELFSPLNGYLRAGGFASPFEVADVGCGTGLAALSLVRSGVPVSRLYGVDPDSMMLAQARELPGLAERGEIEFHAGAGEKTGLGDGCVDALIVGSAFHWMDAESASREFLRVLRPRGVLLVFEYQFPKCAELPGLNEWIRREFNLRWKAPDQKPRGDFKSVTRVFRDCPTLGGDATRVWVPLPGPERVPMKHRLEATELQGLILSQSRVLHYENTLTASELAAFRARLLEELQARYPREGGAPQFDFSLTSAWFQKN